MNFQDFALRLYPYWLSGAGILLLTYFSEFRDVIRVEKKPIIKFIKFLCYVTMVRFLLAAFIMGHMSEAIKNITSIPDLATLFVFWEDAVHTLPLYLLRLLIGTSKWSWPIHIILTALVMLEFGLGHMYQGLFNACLLSLYVPVTIGYGKKYGFGTVMICHTLFDLTTVFTMNLLSRLFHA